jgi:spermidine synthase
MAAYATPEMTMTFFEIDPIVIRVASDPRFFTYLSDAPRAPRLVLGDARLSLEDEPTASFDMLVLDAFSSDAIPVHLLTREAIADELRSVRPGGLLAFHISNRYYDLTPAIAAGAQSLGLTVLERFHAPSARATAQGATPSHWLAASSDPETLGALGTRGWHVVAPADRPFTDDYADLIRYLRLTE